MKNILYFTHSTHFFFYGGGGLQYKETIYWKKHIQSLVYFLYFMYSVPSKYLENA